MRLTLNEKGKRVFAPRVLADFEAPPGEFDCCGATTRDRHGGVAIWTKNGADYRHANNPAVLAAYGLDSPTPTRTVLIPSVPVTWAMVASMPGGDWIIGGATATGVNLLRVVTPTGALRAELRPDDTVSNIAVDSDGFVWVGGSALTKYDSGLQQLWQSPGGPRDDWSTDVVNLGRGEVFAGQSYAEEKAVLLRIRDGHDAVLIPVPKVECLDLVISDGDWVGFMADEKPTMIVGTVAGDVFEERFRVKMRDDCGDGLCADDSVCRGDTAYIDDGDVWYVVTLGELLADPPQPTPQDAAPPGRRGWFGWGRG